MELAASRSAVEVGTRRPVDFTVHRVDGRVLVADDVRVLGDERRLVDATSLASDGAAIRVRIDLRGVGDLPEPGTHTLVVSVGTAVVAVAVEVTDDRSCVGLAGIVPTVELAPPSSVTLKARLMNRCGHAVSLDLTISWAGREWSADTVVGVGASSFVDAEVRFDVAAAGSALRDGRLPDDVTIVVRKSGPGGGVELELAAEDLRPVLGPAPDPPRPRRFRDHAAAGAWGVVLLGAGVLAGIAVANSGGNDPVDVVAAETAPTSDPATTETTETTAPLATTAPTVPTEPTGTAAPVMVTVGEYVGLRSVDAETAVSAAGLVPATRTEPTSDPGLDDVVIDQDVAGGTDVAPGSTITLVVGELVGEIVPDVTGLPAGQAAEILDEIQRILGEDRPTSPEELVCAEGGDGRVIEQSPEAGTVVTEPFPVQLTVAASCEEVPDLVGTGLADARAELDRWRAAGLTFARDESCPDPSSDQAVEAVISDVAPAPGTIAPAFTISCRARSILR